MKQLHALWLLVTTGVTALTEVGQMLVDGAKLKFRSATGGFGVRTVLDDTDIVSTLGGNETDKVPSVQAVATAVAGASLTVHPNSTAYMEINNGQIEITPYLITEPKIDAVSTSLSDALNARTPVYDLTSVSNGTADLQAGDSLILPSHTGGIHVFLHNGGTTGTASDFTLVENPSFDSSAIRALFTAMNGIVYDNLSGQFKLGGEINEVTDVILNAFTGSLFFRDSGNDINFRLVNFGSKKVQLEYKLAGIYMEDDIVLLKSPSGNLSQFLFQDRRNTPNKRGIEVDFTNYSGLTPNSLTPKGYVDSLITNGRFNVTLNTTANVWTSISHNFNLPSGSFDCFVVSAFDSTGEGVGLRFRSFDANTMQVMTAEAVTGLRVRLLKTV